MKTIHARTIAAVALVVSAGFNLTLAVASLWSHHYAAAGAQSVLVALLATWLAMRPTLDAWLDATLAAAIAQQAAAVLILEATQRAQREGGRIGVRMAGARPSGARLN